MIDFEKLWQYVIQDPDLRQSYIHGPEHWTRVERNGLYIGNQVGADIEVISLFALFHDSKRQNDSIDLEHGKRGGEYAKILRNRLFEISDNQFNLFFNACLYHTKQIHTNNITMAVCWDADRLDLGRIGMRPSSKFMNTDIAKDIAENYRWDLLEELPVRNIKDSSLRSEKH